jgi:YaiO family outer membrane protein
MTMAESCFIPTKAARFLAWKIFSLAILLLLQTVASAQPGAAGDPDSAFKAARELAFAGKRVEGRALAQQIVARYPDYLEIRTFIGRTFAWGGLYDSARREFAAVTAANPRTLDNYLAWIDAERWDGQLARALELTEQGLTYFNGNTDLLYRKAKLYSVTGRLADAKLLTHRILRIDPKHGPANILLQELRSQLLYNGVSAGVSYESFSSYYQPATYAFVQGSRITAMGSIIGRLNTASRSGRQALQPEIDLYPKIYKGVYGYLNYGYSNGTLFPRHRIGAEIFTSLPASFEASLGLRYLNFDPDTRVTIYTGSVGYYTGNYWLSGRLNLAPDSASTSLSFSLTARRYFKNPDRYFSIRAGAGFSPEVQVTPTITGEGIKSFYTLGSQSLSLAYQHPLSKQWRLNGSASIGSQYVPFNGGDRVISGGLAASLQYRFK